MHRRNPRMVFWKVAPLKNFLSAKEKNRDRVISSEDARIKFNPSKKRYQNRNRVISSEDACMKFNSS